MRADSADRKTHEPAWPVSNPPAPSLLPVPATDHHPLTTDNDFVPTAYRRLPTAFVTRSLP